MSDFVVYYILSVLGVYRVSHMIVTPSEEGPFEILSWIRDKTKKQSNWFERGMNCVLCLSFWISFIPAIGFFRSSFEAFFLYWFAIAGGVLVVHKYFNKR